MSYQFTSSRGNKAGKRRNLILGALGICLVLFVILRFAPGFSGSIAEDLSSPFLKTGSVFGRGFTSFTTYFTSRNSLEAENESLKESLLEANMKVVDEQQVALQNQQLQALLGRPNTMHSIVAGILSRPNQSPYDTFTVDAGTAEGAAVGDVILAGTDIPVGTITSIYNHTSRITLYSSSGNTVNVLVGNNHVAAQATGQGGSNFIIKIPRGVPVSVGDSIIAPGITVRVFGTVAKIDLAPNDSFQTIYFNLPININELQFVEIIPTTN